MAQGVSTVQDERERNVTDTAAAQAKTYAQRSAEREAKINLPDLTGTTTAEREARIVGNVNTPFNTPFKTGPQGERILTTQVKGDQGQTFSAKPPLDVRNILMQGGRRTEDQENRLSRFNNSSAGQNFDFGNFQSSLQKLRRGALGEKEWERQMDTAFKEQPKMAASPIGAATSDSGAPTNTIAPRDIDPPDSSVDTDETAMIDSLDSIDSPVFETQSLALA